jgi:Holliday junction resolvase-like predicted endonuclease
VSVLIAVLLCIILLLFGAIVALKNKVGRSSKRRNRRAHDGETAAIKLLNSNGYKIEGKHVRRKSGMYVDGEWLEIEVRADFIATKKRKKFVVEVKTGTMAPNPTHAATRRQLLEYSLIFEGHEMLLVDMEEKLIKKISF